VTDIFVWGTHYVIKLHPGKPMESIEIDIFRGHIFGSYAALRIRTSGW
jgi:hypothetical protein